MQARTIGSASVVTLLLIVGCGFGPRKAAAQIATTDTMAMAIPEWVVVSGAEGVTIEVNFSRLTRDSNGIIRGWERRQHTTPQRSENGKTYISTMVQAHYDCDGRRSKLLQGVSYDRRGNVVTSWTLPVYSHEWHDVVPESIGEGTLNAVCAYFGQ